MSRRTLHSETRTERCLSGAPLQLLTAAAIAWLAIAAGCATQQTLLVRARKVTQGVLTVECSLDTRGPDYVRLVLDVRSPCSATAARVRAFRADTELGRAAICKLDAIPQTNTCYSDWFPAPEPGTELTGSVWGQCAARDAVQGEDVCRMP